MKKQTTHITINQENYLEVKRKGINLSQFVNDALRHRLYGSGSQVENIKKKIGEIDDEIREKQNAKAGLEATLTNVMRQQKKVQEEKEKRAAEDQKKGGMFKTKTSWKGG